MIKPMNIYPFKMAQVKSQFLMRSDGQIPLILVNPPFSDLSPWAKKTHGQPRGFKRVSFVDELEACMARGAEVAEKADEVMQLGWQWLVSGEIMVVTGVFISAVYEC
jgi:hypothetical protein